MSKVNKKRLVIELVIIIAIISVVMLGAFLPWFFSQAPSQDPYAEYNSLYQLVAQRGNTKEPDHSLEEKLAAAISSEHNIGARAYFNYKARANYYLSRGFIHAALADLEQAISFTPDRAEYLSTAKQMVELAHQIKDYDKESKYQRLLDRI